MASIENVSVSRDDTASSCSSAARWRAAAAASCALWTAIAAWSAIATRISSSSLRGRQPDSGSSTERMPIRWPSEWRSGTKRASSGCQLPASGAGSPAGTYDPGA